MINNHKKVKKKNNKVKKNDDYLNINLFYFGASDIKERKRELPNIFGNLKPQLSPTFFICFFFFKFIFILYIYRLRL